MLVLFETPAGFAIFKLLDEKKLLQSDNLFEDFATPEGAKKVVKLKMFEKFKDTTDALASAAALIEGILIFIRILGLCPREINMNLNYLTF